MKDIKKKLVKQTQWQEIPAIEEAGSGDQRHANERFQSALVCCTTRPEA